MPPENEFTKARDLAENWWIVPLLCRHGELPMERRSGFGVRGQMTYGTSIIVLFAREHLHLGDFDATVACCSQDHTLIARLRVSNRNVSVEEARDAAQWKEHLTKNCDIRRRPLPGPSGGSTLAGGAT